MYAAPCHCIGTPLRFEPEVCFTCGRFLTHIVGNVEPAGDRQGMYDLLAAVERKRIQIEKRRRTSVPAPRHRHRRVVIEPPPKPKASPKQKTHGGARKAPRSSAVRAVEYLTRTF